MADRQGPCHTLKENTVNNFDNWYYEQCQNDAAELVGPNAPEYEQCVERFYEDEGRREAHRIRYNLEHA